MSRWQRIILALAFASSPALVACGGSEPADEPLAENDPVFEEGYDKADFLGKAKFCGGIAGLPCPKGYKCKPSGNYPDAGGKCVPTNYCDTAADCQGLVSPLLCIGDWQCSKHKCQFKCGLPPAPKKCGPLMYLPACGKGETCNLQSCGLGATGTCAQVPQACAAIYAPVCGCDGKTYGNDCERLLAGAALDHKGECQNKCWGAWLDQNGNCRTPADGVYPAECCAGQFCGGIAGILCPTGYTCQLGGTYPDAGGKCVKDTGPTCANVKCAGGTHCEMKGINGGAIPVCIKDPTCYVGGCSSQLCTDKPDAVSTCELLPWYGCYKLSQCGNFGPSNGCAWKQTPAFQTCMAQNGK